MVIVLADDYTHVTICPTRAIFEAVGYEIMGALVHAWLQDYPLAQSARFARACAALAVGAEETVFTGLSQAAVERMLETYPC